MACFMGKKLIFKKSYRKNSKVSLERDDKPYYENKRGYEKMIQQKKQQTLFWSAVMVFLCCYFMMLFDFPNRITILLGSLICLMLLVRQKAFRLDLNTVLLTVTIASYYIILYGTRAFTMSLPYVGILLYVLGNYLSAEVREKTDHEKYFMGFLWMLILGHAIHGILNSMLFLDGQLFEGDIRVWKDIWMPLTIPGTQQIVYFLPVIAMVFPAMAYFKKKKITSSLMLILAVFFIYISMASQTRTSVLILPLVFGAQFVLYVILEWERVKKIICHKNTKIAAAAVLLLVIIAIMLLKDHPLVSSFIDIMDRDGGIFNNIRFKLQRSALQQLPLYPMGGDQMDFMGYPYAHNAWLDMANMAGWIPFFAFTAYTVHVVWELICWLREKDVPTERKLILAGIFGAFFLYYTVERAFDGSLHFMTPWFFINGLVHAELGKKKDK